LVNDQHPKGSVLTHIERIYFGAHRFGLNSLKILVSAIILSVLISNVLFAKKNRILPEATAIDSIFGHTISVEDKVVYLDFWASWCPHCQQSIPWMDRLKTRYGKKGLQIMTINLDRDPALARAFLKKIAVNLPVYFDSTGSIAELFDIQVMPTSFIYSRDGKVYKCHQGFKTEDMEELEAVFDTLLNTGE
jgi:thiol-disulfide isomerase/thioredoxin